MLIKPIKKSFQEAHASEKSVHKLRGTVFKIHKDHNLHQLDEDQNNLEMFILAESSN